MEGNETYTIQNRTKDFSITIEFYETDRDEKRGIEIIDSEIVGGRYAYNFGLLLTQYARKENIQEMKFREDLMQDSYYEPPNDGSGSGDFLYMYNSSTIFLLSTGKSLYGNLGFYPSLCVTDHTRTKYLKYISGKINTNVRHFFIYELDCYFSTPNDISVLVKYMRDELNYAILIADDVEYLRSFCMQQFELNLKENNEQRMSVQQYFSRLLCILYTTHRFETSESEIKFVMLCIFILDYTLPFQRFTDKWNDWWMWTNKGQIKYQGIVEGNRDVREEYRKEEKEEVTVKVWDRYCNQNGCNTSKIFDADGRCSVCRAERHYRDVQIFPDDEFLTTSSTMSGSGGGGVGVGGGGGVGAGGGGVGGGGGGGVDNAAKRQNTDDTENDTGDLGGYRRRHRRRRRRKTRRRHGRTNTKKSRLRRRRLRRT